MGQTIKRKQEYLMKKFATVLLLSLLISCVNNQIDIKKQFHDVVVYENDLKKIDEMLDNGFDIHSQVRGDRSALASCIRGHGRRYIDQRCELEVVVHLLDRGADPWKMYFYETQNRWLRTHALHYAAEHGRTDFVLYLNNRFQLPIDTPSQFGETPLVWAATGGHEATVDMLLELGADSDQKGAYGETWQQNLREGIAHDAGYEQRVAERERKAAQKKKSSGVSLGKIFAVAAVGGLAVASDLPTGQAIEAITPVMKDISNGGPAINSIAATNSNYQTPPKIQNSNSNYRVHELGSEQSSASRNTHSSGSTKPTKPSKKYEEPCPYFLGARYEGTDTVGMSTAEYQRIQSAVWEEAYSKWRNNQSADCLAEHDENKKIKSTKAVEK